MRSLTVVGFWSHSRLQEEEMLVVVLEQFHRLTLTVMSPAGGKGGEDEM